MGKYFGTDGVRGEANKELTPELAFKLGRCGGYVLSQHEEEGKRPRVLVGRDTRISGQMLEEALTEDITLPDPYQLVLQTNSGINQIMTDETGEKHAVLSFEFMIAYGFKCK